MKYLLIIFLLLSFVKSKSQQTYDATVSFPMTDTSDEAGTAYHRKGFIEGMVYNQGIQTISVLVRIKFFINTTELKRFTGSYRREIIIDNETFVVSATGAVVGTRDQMRTLYGVIQSQNPTVWRQSVFGGDSLTTPCMGQYYYLTSQFDQATKFHLILKAIATTAANAGKLN